MKRYLNNISKLNNSIAVKNPSAHFILKILADQDLEPMLK